ncbi:MAG: CHAT domain-containing protein [Chloroflexota bacterium]
MDSTVGLESFAEDKDILPIATATGVRAIPRRFVMRLVHGDLTRRRAECFAVNRYLGVPMSGAARAVNQFMGNTLEAFAQRSGFNEQPGSVTFVPARYAPFSADVVAIISMGEYERFVVTTEENSPNEGSVSEETSIVNESGEESTSTQWVRQQLTQLGYNLAVACCQVDLRDVASTVHGAGPNSKVDPALAVQYFITGYLNGLKEYAQPGQSYFLTLVELEEEKIERIRLGIDRAMRSGDCELLIPVGSPLTSSGSVSEPWAWLADLDLVPAKEETVGIPRHLRLGALLQSDGALKLSTIGTTSADQVVFDQYPRNSIQQVRKLFEKLHDRSVGDLAGLSPLLRHDSPSTRQEAAEQIEAVHADALLKTGQFGSWLFNEIFDSSDASNIRQRLTSVETNKLLLLRLDEATASIPWELMVFEGDDGHSHMLSLERSIGRQLEMVGQVRQPPPRDSSLGSRLKVLIVANPTQDLPQVEKESRRIIDDLYQIPDIDIQVTALFGEEAMRPYVEYLLNEQFDIFHYAGHAFFDPNRPNESGLVLAGKDVLTAEMMWELPTPPRLVFFNACESAATVEAAANLGSRMARRAGQRSEQQAGQYIVELPLGSISALLRAGTQNFIGTQWRVEDSVAAEMAIACYTALASGYSVGESLVRARLSIIKKLGFGHFSWASYVLYGSPWNSPLA